MPFRVTPITDSASMAPYQPLSTTPPKEKKVWLATLLPSVLWGAALLSLPAQAQVVTADPVVQSVAQPAQPAQPGGQTKQADEADPAETLPTESGSESAPESASEAASEEEIPAEEGAAAEGVAENITTGLNPDTNSSWQRFTSEEGAFSISMPSQPAAYAFTPNTDTAEALTASSRMYMQMQLVSPHHLEIYAAASIASANLTNADNNLSAALMSCVSSLSDHGALRATPTPIILGHYHGLEAEFLTPEGALQVSRCYLTADRAYMLTATSELFSPGTGLQPLIPTGNAAVRSPAMDTFFNSFEILN